MATDSGLLGLLSAVRRSVMRRETYFVYEFAHENSGLERLPEIDGMSEVFVTSNREAEELCGRRDDPRGWVKHARQALDKGAVLYCVYAGDRLAHSAWLAVSEEARRAIDEIGFDIPFGDGVVWTGRVRTAPEFRGRGLFEYGCLKRFEYLTRLGIRHSRTSIGCANAASHAMAHKLGGTLTGKGHIARVLRWHWWVDDRLTSADGEYVVSLTSGAAEQSHRVTSATCRPASSVVARGWRHIRERGFAAFGLEAFRRYVFDVRRFYLYEHRHNQSVERGCLIDLGAYEEFFIADNSTADLVVEQREDFRRYRTHAREALEAGAVAFCIYDGRRLAHLGWVAISRKARRALDHLGYKVSFEGRQGWTGAAFTSEHMRSRGLLLHSCQRRFEYLRSCGIESSRAAVEIGNLPSHRATMRFNPRVYAVGRQVKLLGFRWWSERAFDGFSTHER